MADFLTQGGTVTLILAVWTLFLLAVWRAVSVEARDRCAVIDRNRAQRVTARRETLRAWRADHTPQYAPPVALQYAEDAERYIDAIERAIRRGDAHTAAHFAKASARSALLLIGKEY